MPTRTAKFAYALLAGFLASAPFTATSQGATPAAADCLASPKDQAPQGSHWHYHIEHPSNRHCWYLRGEHDAGAQPAAGAAATGMSSSNTTTAMPGSIANAHAELTSPQAGGDQDSSAAIAPSPAAAAGNAATTATAPGASVPDANMLRSVVASRWPDQLAANSAAVAPAADRPQADAPVVVDAAVADAAQPAAAVPLAAADSSEKRPISTQTLLIAIVAALSVAGLAASAVGFGGRRTIVLSEPQQERRAIWQTTADGDGALPAPFPAAAAARPNIGIPRELHEANDPDDKIAEMLARLARSAQA